MIAENERGITSQWDTIKNSYVETAAKVLGYKTKTHKMLSTKSPWLQQKAQEAYRNKDKDVKKSARSDKRSFIEGLAEEAEHAARQGQSGTIYKITKHLCGKYTNHSAPVKDKSGNSITTEREQAARWVEHFRDILNRPEPEEPANLPPVTNVLDINTRHPTEPEVKNAMKAMKSENAPGINSIHAEMLK